MTFPTLTQTPAGPRYLCPCCGREWESATEAVLCEMDDPCHHDTGISRPVTAGRSRVCPGVVHDERGR